ncbi:hypothetical protein FA95DRAFT_1567799 [Auriscalpium vulgare]|uniref:Uncharacterized protein n=1 Tax=Auriscalpium vulgare TaxID=40419 RepID=A0ACB8R3L2_9AGAM|nr:hypothetical protein FA95DRAFT_1567799 [Auriscalpium vulgare]
MSSLPGSYLLYGNFCLAGGKTRTPTSRNGQAANPTFHRFYDTTISLADGTTLQAQLRIWSPSNDVGHPDNTVVFATVKAHSAAGSPALLDVMSLIPYPGNPSDADYDDPIPVLPSTFVGIGVVRSQGPETAADGLSRAFLLDVSDYVRDSTKTSTIQCFFDHTSPRWTRTPFPNHRSIVQVTGFCHGLTKDGDISIRIESIVFGLGTANAASFASGTNSASPGPSTPTKQRKYSAYATPSPRGVSGGRATVMSSPASSPQTHTPLIAGPVASTSYSSLPGAAQGPITPEVPQTVEAHHVDAEHVGDTVEQGMSRRSAKRKAPGS